MKNKYASLILLGVMLLALPGFAQQELTLHLLDNVYQATHTNPAFRTRSNKINVTIFSSAHLSLRNSGFTYNQLAANIKEDETGQRIIDLQDVQDNLNLNGRDYVHASFNADLFALSFPAGKNRFSLNVTEHIQGRLHYDASILELATTGNAPGQTFQFGNYELNAIHFREFGIGWNRPFLEENKLTVGTRLKAVFGLGNIQTQYADVSLTTGTEQELYAITTNANVRANTSGVDMLEDDLEAYLFNLQNVGFGIDIGGTYELNNQISFSASVINLGMISWQEDAKAYTSEGEFTFTGVDNDDLLTEGFDIDIEQLTDSIADVFDLEEEEAQYTTGLPTQMYLTGNYQLARRTTASATLYSDFYRSFRRGFALGIRQNVGRWLQAAATYSVQNRSFNNLGAGLSLTTGPGGIQLYCATDNILALTSIGGARVANMRAGFNFVF
ncbi:DUF5723 family protein [Tunicatimonas pelagia]|uniref:DUF5723 family protein n=1 Tax=Tunicatimonas pelagia TaxID=931531 RepID=UPI002665B216|nr:DUF5723 family protein [Tunicatimonas pelagia]WKN42549.1 DUF5723 family protein [Tunicatimonas pelagia]